MQVHGGAPYGAGCLAGDDGLRQPSDFELGYACHQARDQASVHRTHCEFELDHLQSCRSPSGFLLACSQGKYFAGVLKKLGTGVCDYALGHELEGV